MILTRVKLLHNST